MLCAVFALTACGATQKIADAAAWDKAIADTKTAFDDTEKGITIKLSGSGKDEKGETQSIDITIKEKDDIGYIKGNFGKDSVEAYITEDGDTIIKKDGKWEILQEPDFSDMTLEKAMELLALLGMTAEEILELDEEEFLDLVMENISEIMEIIWKDAGVLMIAMILVGNASELIDALKGQFDNYELRGGKYVNKNNTGATTDKPDVTFSGGKVSELKQSVPDGSLTYKITYSSSKLTLPTVA